MQVSCMQVAGPVGWVAGVLSIFGGGILGHAAGHAVEDFSELITGEDFFLPLYAISPFEIFAGLIPALNVNFLNVDNSNSIFGTILEAIENAVKNPDELSGIDTAKVLSPQIAKWYVAIRNLVLVGLMVVLLYIGIRIIISSTAGEKAKYKEHIKDWIVAVLLVVFMHYIMAFSLTITEYITLALNKENSYIPINFSEEQIKNIEEQTGIDIEGTTYYTNLLGYARIMSQSNASGGQFAWEQIGYTIIFVVLVIYTVMFLIIYLKRVIYMAFLTMIAPLVALTYPIDKISDGQAQAFNMWLKEYIFNLLLQPFHLLLYTMLVGSAMDLAKENMVYALVALGFLMPAEKLLRRFFGFDQKAPETGSIVGGVVGGSMAMSAINSMRRIGSVGQRRNGKKEVSSGNSENDRGKTRLASRKPDSDKKASVEELLMDENSKEDSANIDISDSNRLDPNSNLTIRTSVSPNVSQNMVSEENNLNGQSNSESSSEPFNPYSDYERLPFNTKSINTEDITGNAKDWLTNLPPIRGLNNMARGARDKISNEFNKGPIRRDIKRLTIRGAKTLKPALGTALHYTGKGLASVGKKVPRIATKAALGATLGTVGVAAGISTGDLSNVAAYGAAAAGVGASVGEGVSNIAINIGNSTKGAKNVAKDMRSDYEARKYTKEERKARQNAREDEEWKKDKDVIKMYKEEYGKQYKDAMETALKYREYGVVNDKAIMKKMNDIGIKSAPSKRDIAATKAASTIRNEEQLRGLSDRLRNNGVPEREIIRLEDDVRKMNVSGEFV